MLHVSVWKRRDELAIQRRVPRTLLDSSVRRFATMPERKVLLLADVLEKFGRPEKYWSFRR
jgi:hypothetical protein